MSTNESGKMTLTAAAAITRGQRLKLNSSRQWAVAGDERTHAIALNSAASGEACVGLLLGAKPGTFWALVDEASAVGALLYPQTGGKYGDTAGTAGAEVVGMEAATADGDIIEVMFCPAISDNA